MDPNKLFMPESFAPTYYEVIKITKPKKLDVAQNEKIPLLMHGEPELPCLALFNHLQFILLKNKPCYH